MLLVFVSRMYPHRTAPKNQWVIHIVLYFHEVALSLHIGIWKVNSSLTGSEAYSAEGAGNQWIQCVLGHRVHHSWRSSLNRSTGRFMIMSRHSVAQWLVLLVNSFSNNCLLQEQMSKCMQNREHQYIFEPVCASVLLRRNASKEPLRSRNTPRIEGQVQLEPLSLRLSQVTFFKIFKCHEPFLYGVFLTLFEPSKHSWADITCILEHMWNHPLLPFYSWVFFM